MPNIEASTGRRLRLPAFVGPFAMGLGFLTVVLLASTTLWLMERMRVTSAWVEHSYAVQGAITALRGDIRLAEGARRGLLLDPDPSLVAAYEASASRVPRDLNTLGALISDDAVQTGLLRDLRPLVTEHVRAQAGSVLGVRVGARAPAIRAFARDGSTERIARIESVLARMSAHEAQLLAQRQALDRANLSLVFTTTVAGVSVVALLGLLSIAAYGRDAAALQRSRETLAVLNADLERTVAERTMDLDQATAEIQRFAHLVSHDLRAPLVNIMGFTDELRRVRADLDAPEQPSAMRADMDEAIHFIQASTQKMDRLINSILRMAREGRRTLTAQAVDLNELIEAQIATVSHAAQQRGVEVSVEGRLPDIVSDRLALEQVFANLVDNAVKYSKPDQPGRVVVRGKDTGGWIEIEVEDDGIGVDPKDHLRIFDMFRRAAGAEQPGEGVGLAYTRHIVRRLGGVIAVRSALGEGAAFRVRLPKRLTPAPGRTEA